MASQQQRTTLAIVALALWLLACLIFLRSRFIVAWDLSQYLVYAENYLNTGQFLGLEGEPVEMRPLFVYLLSGLLLLFNHDISAVQFTLAILSAILIPATFLLPALHGRPNEGIVAAIALLAMPEIVVGAPRHLDALWPLCLALALIAMTAPRQGLIKAAWSALAVAFAAGIKPVALLFLPVPALWWAMTSSRFSLSVTFYLSFSLIYLVLFSFNPAEEFVGSGQETRVMNAFRYPFDLLHGSWPWGIGDFLRAMAEGYWDYFLPSAHGAGLFLKLPYSTPLVLAILGYGIDGIRRKHEGLLYMLTFLVFAPFLALCGIYQLRTAQFLLLFVLGVLAMVALCRMALESLTQRIKTPTGNRMRNMTPLNVLVITSLLLAGYLFSAKWAAQQVLPLWMKGRFMGPSAMLRGAELLRWRQQLGENITIYGDSAPTVFGLFVAGKGQTKVKHLPWFYLPGRLGVDYYQPIQELELGGAVFLDLFGPPGNPQTVILGLSVEGLRAELRRHSPSLLIIQKGNRDLIDFLERVAGFVQIPHPALPKELVVFREKPAQSRQNAMPVLSANAQKHLEQRQALDPKDISAEEQRMLEKLYTRYQRVER